MAFQLIPHIKSKDPDGTEYHAYKIHDGTTNVGMIDGTVSPHEPNVFKVSLMYHDKASPSAKNPLGARGLYQIARSLKQHNPELTHVSTVSRISGVRAANVYKKRTGQKKLPNNYWGWNDDESHFEQPPEIKVKLPEELTNELLSGILSVEEALDCLEDRLWTSLAGLLDRTK